MINVAKEKKQYLDLLASEFVEKNKTKRALKTLIDERGIAPFTSYASLKMMRIKTKKSH